MATARRRISEFHLPFFSAVRLGPLVTSRSLSHQRGEALSSSSFEKLKAGFRVNFTVNLFCISANEIFMELGDGSRMLLAPVSSCMWSGELSKQSSKLQDGANSEEKRKKRRMDFNILRLQVNLSVDGHISKALGYVLITYSQTRKKPSEEAWSFHELGYFILEGIPNITYVHVTRLGEGHLSYQRCWLCWPDLGTTTDVLRLTHWPTGSHALVFTSAPCHIIISLTHELLNHI